MISGTPSSPRGTQPDGSPTTPAVREALRRVLDSPLFSRSERLSSFLAFIVEQTLDGHGASLKEQVIAMEVYGKDATFTTAADPIVRVDARRLRDRLREYYEAARDEPVIISVPKGSYTPVFQWSTGGHGRSTSGDRSSASRESDRVAQGALVLPSVIGTSLSVSPLRRWWAAGAALLVVLGALVTWFAVPRAPAALEAPRLLTVTALPGAEEDPSLSPDGNFVAFSWTSAAPGAPHDIWVKAVDGDVLRQLTDTPEVGEKWPAWSPDGQQIAFARLDGDTPGVFVMSSLGGAARLVAERGTHSAWTPDSRALVIAVQRADRSVLVHHALATGAPRVLAEAPNGFVDRFPRVSPDGSRVAFTRSASGRSGLYVMPLSSAGAPVRIREAAGIMGGLTWTPDGEEILCAEPQLTSRRLMRVAAHGRTPASPVTVAPMGVSTPSVSQPRDARGYRLAMAVGHPDVGMRLVDLRAESPQGTLADVPFSDSTRMDMPGRFSPDGSEIAFASERGGDWQVWVARRDGSALRSVTRLENATVNVNAWSPDGQWLLFDATIDDNSDLYVVRADGSGLKQLTDGAASEYDGEWSRDGRWIYYVSEASGSAAVWRRPPSGGPGVRITSEAAFDPRESSDGRTIYFVDRRRTYARVASNSTFGMTVRAALKQVPAEGGPATLVYADIVPGAWEVTDAGILFVDASAPAKERAWRPTVLALYDPAARRVRRLGELHFQMAPYGTMRYLIASRDGRWALASHIDRWERDILVLDGFR